MSDVHAPFETAFGQWLESRGQKQLYFAKFEDPPKELDAQEADAFRAALNAPVTCIHDIEHKIQILLVDADHDWDGQHWVEVLCLLLRDLTNVRMS